jgi:ribosome-associated translation inhibitor RaiA
MQLPLRITFRGFASSPAVEANIRMKADKLERLHPRITGCHVLLDAPHRHHHTGRIFSVRIEVTIPGAELIASREPAQDHAHEDVYVAIRDAFDAIARQLEDTVRRQRGDVKQQQNSER